MSIVAQKAWLRNSELLTVSAREQLRSAEVFDHTLARDYYDRKLTEGKTRRGALRALKRQLCNVIWRHLTIDSAVDHRALSTEAA